MNGNKIKAGALQMTTYITVIIALMLFTFVLFIHTHKKIQVKHELALQTIQLSELGVHYVLNNNINFSDSLDLKFEQFPNFVVL